MLLRVAGREFAVEEAIADLVLRAMATAVPLTLACPGSDRQAGVLRWDPAYGPLFRRTVLGSLADRSAADSDAVPSAAVRVHDPATWASVDLVGAPGMLAWPAAHTDTVVDGWRTRAGWCSRGLPDLTRPGFRKLDPDVTVDPELMRTVS